MKISPESRDCQVVYLIQLWNFVFLLESGQPVIIHKLKCSSQYLRKASRHMRRRMSQSNRTKDRTKFYPSVHLRRIHASGHSHKHFAEIAVFSRILVSTQHDLRVCVYMA